jgi:hypothetical protein
MVFSLQSYYQPGGKIAVESKVNEGAKFIITFKS